MINWDKAPEGTTHCVFGVVLVGSPWRKVDVENDKVYDWKLKIKEGRPEGEWQDRHHAVGVEDYLDINKNFLEERPAPPVEAELPEGKVWPEDADFYYPALGVFFRWDAPGFKYPHDAAWSALMPMHIEQYAKKDVIHRFPEAQPKAAPKKEEPPKKRAVGWWS